MTFRPMLQEHRDVITKAKPELVWHQYHTYLCILGSDMRLGVSSNPNDTRNHPAYAGLIIMGNVIINYLKVDVVYGEPGWTRLMLLGDLVPKDDQPTIPEQYRGALRPIWDIWRDWALKDWQ